MHNAVQGMMTHYRFTLACFTVGLICFMISAWLYSWMQFDWTLSLPMTLLILYFLFILQRYYWRIYRRFRLPSEAVVSGAFNLANATVTPDGAYDHAAAEAQKQAAEAEAEQQMDHLRQQYGHLPESVRVSMGLGNMGIGSSGGAGPSSGH